MEIYENLANNIGQIENATGRLKYSRLAYYFKQKNRSNETIEHSFIMRRLRMGECFVKTSYSFNYLFYIKNM